MVENKEIPKTTNPYTRLAPFKCFKWNLPGHKSSDCLLRKAVHLVEREDEEIICEPEGDGEEEEEDYEEGDERHNYMVRTLMVISTQENKSENMSSPTFPIIAHSEQGFGFEINQLKDRASKFLGYFWKLLWKMNGLFLESSCIWKVQKTQG